MLGKSCLRSTRILLARQSGPLSLGGTGGFFAFSSLDAMVRALSGPSTFPLSDRPALQIGRRVQWSCTRQKSSIRYGTCTQRALLIRSYGGIEMNSGEPCAK